MLDVMIADGQATPHECQITIRSTRAGGSVGFEITLTPARRLNAGVRRNTKMAVNHADGTLFVSVPMYPIVGTYAAFIAGARWSLPVFLVAGLAFGVCIVTASRFALYRGMKHILDSQVMRNANGWPALIAGPPLMLVYIAFPYAVTALGFFLTFYYSVRIAIALAST